METTSTKQVKDRGYEENAIEAAKKTEMTFFDGRNFIAIKKLWELEMEIFGITSENLRLRFIFQRLRGNIRLKVSRDVKELSYNSLLRYLEVNYSLEKKMTLKELREVCTQRRKEEVEDYFRRVSDQTEGRIELTGKMFCDALLEGLNAHIYDRMYKDNFEDPIECLSEMIAAENRAKLRGGPHHRRERTINESFHDTTSFREGPKCYKCGHVGHIATKCYTKPGNFKMELQKKKNEGRKPIYKDDYKKTVEEFFIEENTHNNGCKYVTGTIEGDQLKIKLDTGAEASIIAKKFVKNEIKPSNVVLRTTSKNSFIEHLGVTSFVLEVMGRAEKITAFVVSQLEGKDMLLGMPAMEKFGGRVILCGRTIDSNEEEKNKYNFECDYVPFFQPIKDLITKYYKNDPLKPAKLVPVEIQHKRDIKEDELRQKPYRLAEADRGILEQKIRRMIDCGYLTKKEGTTGMPCFLIKKNGNESPSTNLKNYRMVVDGRRFNLKTKKHAASLDTCEEIVHCIPPNCMKSLIDLEDGFFQLELHKDSRNLCAIVTRDGRYEYNRAPQGAQQSPGAFHSRIKEKFSHLSNVKVYIDDVLIIHQSKESVLNDVKEVLKVLTENNLKVNWNKAKLAMYELEVLGYKLGKENVSITERQSISLKNLKIPATKKQLQKLLATLSFFAELSSNLQKNCTRFQIC